MKKLIIILLLFSGTAFGQTTAQLKFVYPGYTSYWNPKTLIPDSVIYIARPHKKSVGRLSSFAPIPNEPNQDRDYKGSKYDQGHLCNASDENGNQIDEANSFRQCNIFPQTPNDNRIVWEHLENYVRTLAAKYGSVKVKIYWHGVAGYLGIDKVTIPAYCDKEIWYGTMHEKYTIPNTNDVNKFDYDHYKVN